MIRLTVVLCLMTFAAHEAQAFDTMYLTDACKTEWSKYQADRERPKAWAMADDGIECGWDSGSGKLTLQKAVKTCMEQDGATGCRVVDSALK